MSRRAAIQATIHELTARQHGQVTRAQLRAAGLSERMIDLRLQDQTLRRKYDGVYAFGPLDQPLGNEMAACLACGEHAAIGHASAAWLHGLEGVRESGIEVVSWHRHRRPRGLRVHRVTRMPADELTSIQGISVTSAARTVLDLAGSRPLRRAERAVSEGLVRGLFTEAGLTALVDRHAYARGAAILRRFLAVPPTATRSEAEERLLALIRRAHLRAPEVNVRVEGYEVDFLWRRERLVVEVDGVRYHGRAQFEKDRKRDAVLLRANYRTMRVTWTQLQEEPEALLVRLGQTLISP